MIVNYKKIKHYLEKLVAFPTVSNSPTEAIISYLAEILESLGFEVEYYYSPNDKTKSNLLASIGPRQRDGLLLSGHVDVVPTDGQKWVSDPFKLIEKDECFYGRGSVDMKGFIAVIIAVLETIDLKKIKRSLVLLFTYDEEIGCLGSRTFVQQYQQNTSNNPLPDYCIIGEPTNQKVIIQHSGIVIFDILLEGQAAHSSVPSWGINAISDANKIMLELEKIDDLFRQVKPSELIESSLIDPYTTMNIASINGGLAYNIIPEYCKIGVSIRPLSGIDIKSMKEMIFSRLYDLKLRSKITIIEGVEAMALNTSSKSMTTCLVEKYLEDKTPKAVAYCTDGGNLASLNIEPIIFGPGSIEQAHKPNEYIKISELVSYSAILSKMIYRHLIA